MYSALEFQTNIFYYTEERECVNLTKIVNFFQTEKGFEKTNILSLSWEQKTPLT